MESRSLAIESFDEITAEDDTVRKLVDQTGTSCCRILARWF